MLKEGTAYRCYCTKEELDAERARAQAEKRPPRYSGKCRNLSPELIAAMGERPFSVRMGINTGYCNVGNFGSEMRMDYTIIGAEVNLAARLQSQADPGGILLSYETYALVQDHINVEARPPIHAKGIAREMTMLSGLDVIVLFNETFQTGRIDWDCSLLRNAFSVDPISAVQPQPAYYVCRNLCTVLDGFCAARFPVEFREAERLDYFTFQRGDEELLVGAYLSGPLTDAIVEAKSDLTLPGLRARRAWVLDIFNGTEQELKLAHRGADTIIQELLIKDYPVFIRIAK
jgi:hypothetical protein